MLTVHHLCQSQSERIVWLCEELALDYSLKLYERDPETSRAPLEYKALHPIGAAPIITDGDFTLAESGAIVEFVIARYGEGRLSVPSDKPGFADYLYWFHFTNGTLQPAMGRTLVLRRCGEADDSALMVGMRDRLERGVDLVEARLGAAEYLAGDEFTAADIMIGFSLTTMRYFLPLDLSPYPNILAYLLRISSRPGYLRAMRKAEPKMTPLLR